MTWRAALIGCGRIGWRMADDPLMAGDVFTHAEAYAHCPATDLVAVCDADRTEAEACAARWGVPLAGTDIAELLAAARPGIVSVATPDPTHVAVVREVIERGESVRAILCEKPFATNLAEAEALACMARERGVVLAVMHLRRYAPNLRALADLIHADALGEVAAVTGWYTKGVRHNGVHWFDQLRLLAGEASWVEAADRLGEGGEDPTLDVTIGLASGAVATLRALDQHRFTVFETDLLCERGRARIVDSGYRVEVSQAAPSPRYHGYSELVPLAIDLGNRRDVMLHAVTDLCAALDARRAPASTAEDGIAALRIAEAALTAARYGRRVPLVTGPRSIEK